jgi:hypothetical protein
MRGTSLGGFCPRLFVDCYPPPPSPRPLPTHPTPIIQLSEEAATEEISPQAPAVLVQQPEAVTSCSSLIFSPGRFATNLCLLRCCSRSAKDAVTRKLDFVTVTTAAISTVTPALSSDESRVATHYAVHTQVTVVLDSFTS